MLALDRQGLLPVPRFVRVDVDRIRELLPEMREYSRRDARTAGQMTQKEAGLIAEVVSEEVPEAKEEDETLLIAAASPDKISPEKETSSPIPRDRACTPLVGLLPPSSEASTTEASEASV